MQITIRAEHIWNSLAMVFKPSTEQQLYDLAIQAGYDRFKINIGRETEKRKFISSLKKIASL